MFKSSKAPPLEVQVLQYKSLYLKYFNEVNELSTKCIEVKLNRVELKAQIALLKLEFSKQNLPYLGEIT